MTDTTAMVFLVPDWFAFFLTIWALLVVINGVIDTIFSFLKWRAVREIKKRRH